jgi:hypothetical protein
VRSLHDVESLVEIEKQRLDLLRQQGEQLRVTNQVLQEYLPALRYVAQEMVRKGVRQDPGAAAAAATTASVVQSEVSSAQRLFGGAWNKISEALKKVLNCLWALISQLVRVKEWTLTGHVELPFLGGAGIAITFG